MKKARVSSFLQGFPLLNELIRSMTPKWNHKNHLIILTLKDIIKRQNDSPGIDAILKSNNQFDLILVDGLRPDPLTQADVLNLNRLIKESISSLNVRTVIPSVTLPCNTSIYSGILPEGHGTVGNYWNSGDWQGGWFD
jgi:predicted AlkP superfamily pyrophosphatase or phosphodiesterase